MTFDDYIKIDAVNWSTAKHALVSPLHYQYALKAPHKDSPAMRLGREVHTSVLEPDRFALDYIVRPDSINARTNAGKEEIAALEATGRTILTATEYETAIAIRDAVRGHERAAAYFDGPGVNEGTIKWTDPDTGLPCKSRLDRVTDSTVIDLKTAATINAERFGWAALDRSYHAQMAFYQRAVMVERAEILPCVIIAVENKPPFDVAVIEVQEEELDLGRADVDRALRLIAEGRRTGKWPGQYPEPVRLILPRKAWPDPDDSTADLMFGTGE